MKKGYVNIFSYIFLQEQLAIEKEKVETLEKSVYTASEDAQRQVGHLYVNLKHNHALGNLSERIRRMQSLVVSLYAMQGAPPSDRKPEVYDENSIREYWSNTITVLELYNECVK